MFDNIDDLNRIEADCWQLLARAVTDRDCGWRLPVLATAEDTGPRQRIVVLRAVDVSCRRILAHTDVRSAKVVAIQDNPHVSWLFYDVTRQIQLQLTGIATVATDSEDCDRLWDTESPASLRSYLATYSPGTICGEAETNLPEWVQERIPAREELLAGRKNFAVISAVTTYAECVILSRDGNRRMSFRYTDGELNSAEWRAP